MYGLYLVTDRGLCGEKSLENVVLRAVEGGVSCVQLREKGMSTKLFIEEALNIKKILEPRRIPLIINDRVDVALACGAQGVHIGQNDMPYALARKLMGRDAIIGLSVETWTDVEEAQELDVDYIVVSPVFATRTKPDTRGVWGLQGIARVKAFSRHPLVAIGGIDEKNVRDVVKAGAACVACVSAICAASNPQKAARVIHHIMKETLKER